jgi:formiminotetrahydrofolate cyclodeaminase
MNDGSYADDSLRSFLIKLAGRSSEPAGGAALALAGASAAALVSLSCHIGERSARDAGDAQAFRSCQVRSEDMMARVRALIDDDVHAYRDVTQSLRLPRDTDEAARHRRETLDRALLGAVDVPLAVAETALETIDLALATAPRLHSPVMGDLAAAVHLAEAAIAGSLRNARINASAVADSGQSAAATDRIARMAARAWAVREQVAVAFADDPPDDPPSAHAAPRR